MIGVWVALVAVLSAISGYRTAEAQTTGGGELAHAVPFYLRLIVPSIASDFYDLRAYLAENDLSDSADAAASMDEIYLDALELTHGSVTSAMLVSTMGCLEHETIPLHLFGATVDVPLSTEPHSSFVNRAAHIPRHVYGVAEDDRDKLQHIFASAWVKRVTGMTWLARLAGYLVEAGESSFDIEGAEDLRDLHADSDGIRFGTVADPGGYHLPSQSLTANP